MSNESQEIKIRKLEDLIYRHVDKNKRILSTRIINITTPGENFGSTILNIDISLEDEHKAIETLNLFAKMLPQSELYRIFFNVQVTFKLEIAFYEVIIPTLQNFQREKGITDVIDFFSNFYGARANLDNSATVDEDGVILLENLKLSGFVNLNRFIGCNLETSKLILKDMAQLHAVPLALKLQRPEVFEEKVKVFMACFHPEPPEFDNTHAEQKILNILSHRDVCLPLLPKIKKSFKYATTVSKTFREPFATIVHRDIWVNNFMVKLDGEKVVKNKFVDLQVYSYDSPVRDLLFFLFTSVEFEVLKNNLDNLLNFYHGQFINTLTGLGCCTTDFSYEKFTEELKYHGGREIGHILYMLLLVVCVKKGVLRNGDDPGLVSEENILPEAKERAWWLLQEFDNRKWL